ncbi:MAG: hypothetical protein OEY63_02075, partial [Gemmatimonadota bacterium]|nr:hypothetical protein [Gemmatimonadota bacterium]
MNFASTQTSPVMTDYHFFFVPRTVLSWSAASFGRRKLPGFAVIALIAALGCGSRAAPEPLPDPVEAPIPIVRPPIPENEVRALWVVRQTLTHPDSIIAMVSRADQAGFNTLIVQVRGRGDAYYDGGWEPRAESLDSLDFDPLELTIREAHLRGLEVHA